MVLLVCAIVSYAELVIADIQIGFLQFPPVVIGLFFFLVLVNQPIFIKRFVLTPQELILIYCMMVIASMISSRGLMEKLLPALVSVNYFANPTNNWAELFFPHIRPWMVPFDTQILGPHPISIDFYHHINYFQPNNLLSSLFIEKLNKRCYKLRFSKPTNLFEPFNTKF